MPAHRLASVAAVLMLSSSQALAQHDGAGGGAPLVAPAEAKQFDFLVGEWSLEVRPRAAGLAARIHGVPKMAGTWKAWRAFDGWGVEDELRIVDGGGDLQALSHVMRTWDANAQRWSQMGLDVLRARYLPSSAQWSGTEMVSTSQGTDPDGKAYTSKVRFFAITATSFTQEQSRSYDGGKTWDKPLLTIVARRVAPTAGRGEERH